ncbi:ATP-binding protein [Trichothermofontia sp.]
MTVLPTLVLATLSTLNTQVASLLLYQGVFLNPVGQAFLALLSTLAADVPGPIETRGPSPLDNHACLIAYGQWFRALAATGHAWPAYLIQQVLQDDNPFSQQAQRRSLADLPPALVAAARQDLAHLQAIAQLDLVQLSQWVQVRANGINPPTVWSGSTSTPISVAGENPAVAELRSRFEGASAWPDLLPQLVEHYQQQGIEVFARTSALRWQGGQLVGIAHPDRVSIHDLVGYDWQQQALLQNTEFLVRGYRALNVLLYGSRGSGKSSLVKSLLHAIGPGAARPFEQRGLRLIEVDKADLQDLRAIATQLEGLPQKFILFVDDLSFEADESAYKALKGVLEGTLTARPPHVVVYATSNRRHLIREFLGDRPPPHEADEVHAWDTVQEKLSLSDRFGLTLTFPPADQETYLHIVQHLAKQAGLALAPSELAERALQWATRHNGRSGRTARQFVDYLVAELAIAKASSP